MNLEDMPSPIADSFAPNLWANWPEAFKQVRESHRQLEKRLGLAVAALEWYAETNNGGMGLARETLAQIEKGM